MCDWSDAKYANGPLVAEWITERVWPLYSRHHPKEMKHAARRINEWRRGCWASFGTVDRVLTLYGFHVSELPDEVWSMEERRGRRSNPVIRQAVIEAQGTHRDIAQRFGVSARTVRRYRAAA